MAGALTKYFGPALGKQTIGEALRAGGWKIFIDGNLAETLIEHGPGGELVGTDHLGNKYFEKPDAQVGRNRWVVYGGSTHYRQQNPTKIPPEWHGWLHAMTDERPGKGDFVKPIYAVDAKMSDTGTDARYQPKGAWNNPVKRTWRKHQAWEPPARA